MALERLHHHIGTRVALLDLMRLTKRLEARLYHTLENTFGLSEFRPGQEAVIRSALAGRNTLAIMPTGAGKSLCYQLPAVLLPGMTIVISPLIALMKDQCDKLIELGLRASQINSAQTRPGEPGRGRRYRRRTPGVCDHHARNGSRRPSSSKR